MVANTYSFSNFNGVVNDLSGGGSTIIGNGGGVASEGLTFSMIEEKATMTIGADGTPMHSLHSSKGGRVMVRMLKISPYNAILDQIYRYTTNGGGATYGQIVITANDLLRGDAINGSQCGIAKRPDLVYNVEGPALEWTFNVGVLEMILGNGTPA